MKIFNLGYISRATSIMTENCLEKILIASRANNKKIDVSGLLLLSNGHFLQALEGEESVVRMLYDKVIKDPRHIDAKIIYESESETRNFGPWSMAYSGKGYELDLRNAIENLIELLTEGSMVYTPDQFERVIDLVRLSMEP